MVHSLVVSEFFGVGNPHIMFEKNWEIVLENEVGGGGLISLGNAKPTCLPHIAKDIGNIKKDGKIVMVQWQHHHITGPPGRCCRSRTWATPDGNPILYGNGKSIMDEFPLISHKNLHPCGIFSCPV